jgi:hypothetical protein
MFSISMRTLQGKVFYESLYFNGWISIEYPETIFQTASQAKDLVTDAMLHHLGWYKKTKDGHANDAARHLVHRAIRNRERWMLQQIGEFIA